MSVVSVGVHVGVCSGVYMFVDVCIKQCQWVCIQVCVWDERQTVGTERKTPYNKQP